MRTQRLTRLGFVAVGVAAVASGGCTTRRPADADGDVPTTSESADTGSATGGSDATTAGPGTTSFGTDEGGEDDGDDCSTYLGCEDLALPPPPEPVCSQVGFSRLVWSDNEFSFAPLELPPTPELVSVAPPVPRLVAGDLDGDGHTDLWSMTDGAVAWGPLGADASWERRDEWRVYSAPFRHSDRELLGVLDERPGLEVVFETEGPDPTLTVAGFAGRDLRLASGPVRDKPRAVGLMGDRLGIFSATQFWPFDAAAFSVGEGEALAYAPSAREFGVFGVHPTETDILAASAFSGNTPGGGTGAYLERIPTVGEAERIAIPQLGHLEHVVAAFFDLGLGRTELLAVFGDNAGDGVGAWVSFGPEGLVLRDWFSDPEPGTRAVFMPTRVALTDVDGDSFPDFVADWYPGVAIWRGAEGGMSPLSSWSEVRTPRVEGFASDDLWGHTYPFALDGWVAAATLQPCVEP